MTREEKNLLLAELCSRFPYFTMVNVNGKIEVLDTICDDDGFYFNFFGNNTEGYNLDEIKPYLFPLSSISIEQEEELRKLCAFNCLDYLTPEAVDWCNKNYIDHRGMIDMGLALDATGLNIY